MIQSLFMDKRIFNNYRLRQRRKLLRNTSTLAEDILWEKIRRKQILNTKFRRQVSIGNYVSDFFNFELKLAIEVDGKNHDKKEQKEYDEQRQKVLEENNIVFLRFRNNEVLKELDAVLKKIEEKIRELRNNLNATPFGSP